MNIENFAQYTPQLALGTCVHSRGSVIGQVSLGAQSSVWPGAVIRGDMHAITVGERTSIQDNSVVHVTHPSAFNPEGFAVSIGDDVTIGHQVTVHGATINHRVLVGMQTIIMDGAVVESDVIIGAGSLVPQKKVLESGYLYLGRPAVAVRPLTADEMKYLPYVAGNYVALKDKYMQQI